MTSVPATSNIRPRLSRVGTPRRFATLSIALVAAFGAAACGREKAGKQKDPAEVIATYSGGEIRRGDVAAALERRFQTDRRAASPDGRKEIVSSVVRRWARVQLLRKMAETAGIPARPEVKLAVQARGDAVLAEDWLRVHAAAEAKVDPARVEAGVASRLTQESPEQRDFSHVFLRAPEGDAQAVERARALMTRIRQELAEGQPFEELARRYSDSVTARGGGRVFGATALSINKSVRGAVFSQEEGAVGLPVESKDGLHLFRVDAIRRPARPDRAALQKTVEGEQRAEAERVAVEAARTRAWDESGATVDAAVGSPAAPDAALRPAVTRGEEVLLTRADLEKLVRSNVLGGATGAEAARVVVVNRLLAAKRRAEPVDDALRRRLADAETSEVIAVQRDGLLAKEPREVTAEDERAFYDRYRDTVPFLREKVVDVLFFRQEGESVAGVYGAGEEVSRELRSGKTFDAALVAKTGKPGVVVRRALAVPVETLSAEDRTLAGELGKLAPGEVSVPLYMGGERVTFGERSPVIDSKGLVFLRHVEDRPLPFEAVRDRIRRELADQKLAEAIGRVRSRLDEEAAVKILVPEG